MMLLYRKEVRRRRLADCCRSFAVACVVRHCYRTSRYCLTVLSLTPVCDEARTSALELPALIMNVKSKTAGCLCTYVCETQMQQTCLRLAPIQLYIYYCRRV